MIDGGEYVGASHVWPATGVGAVSLMVHVEPVGMPLITWGVPGATFTVPVIGGCPSIRQV